MRKQRRSSVNAVLGFFGLAVWIAAVAVPVSSPAQQANDQQDKSGQRQSGQTSANQQNQQKDRANQSDNRQRRTQTSSQGQSDGVEFPAELKQLDLKADQRDQIQKILQDKDQKLQEAWNDFNDAHMRAVGLEASWVAAVRDALSQDQQQQFTQKHQQRRDQAQERQSARPSELEGDTPNAQKSDRNSGRNQNSAAKNSQTTRSDKNASDRQNAQNRSGDQRQTTSSGDQGSAPDYVIYGITIVSPEGSLDQQSLSDSERQQCSESCRNYQRALLEAWSDADRANARMVDVEADALTSIEKVLTKDQLQQLHQQRAEPASDSNKSGDKQSSSSNSSKNGSNR